MTGRGSDGFDRCHVCNGVGYRIVFRCTGVTELPVVDGDPRNFTSDHVVREQWAVYLGCSENPDYLERTTLPFDLADIHPGDVVLDLGTVEAIDPITEMVDDSKPYYPAGPWWANVDRTVPLVLPSDRITEIEIPGYDGDRP